jgi:hypothetical protein
MANWRCNTGALSRGNVAFVQQDPPMNSHRRRDRAGSTVLGSRRAPALGQATSSGGSPVKPRRRRPHEPHSGDKRPRSWTEPPHSRTKRDNIVLRVSPQNSSLRGGEITTYSSVLSAPRRPFPVGQKAPPTPACQPSRPPRVPTSSPTHARTHPDSPSLIPHPPSPFPIPHSGLQ